MKKPNNYKLSRALSGLNFKQYRPSVQLTEKDKQAKRHYLKKELKNLINLED